MMAGRFLGFAGRVGGMLVAPRSTMASLLEGGRGGLRDFLLLLALQLVAVQLPQLVAAILTLVRISYSAGMTMLLNTIAGSVWIALVAVFAGVLLMGPLTRGCPARERNLDLACLALLPVICLELAASLGFGLAGHRPGLLVARAILAACAVWFVALLLIAVHLVRRRPRAGGEP